ncbi:MAG: biotin transporter BioY [Coriobacteriia bacterium]|nr:biotin transporter BioY [Coriobacteriia bacterium]
MPRTCTARSSALRSAVVAALLASLLAASAWISLPLSPVPVTLQVFVVLLAAMLLTPGWAAAAVGLYVLLGAAGVPVFSGPSGGLGVLVGPTGGYILGFLLGAPAGSAVRRALAPRLPVPAVDALAAAAALAAVYLLGWAQLSAVTGMGPLPALAAGVAPFLPIDAGKGVAAAAVAATLRRVGLAPAAA